MKAHINTPKGTKIMIEGSSEEVSKVVEMFKHEGNPELVEPSERAEGKKFTKSNKNKLSATDLIMNLEVDGFFNKPKTLAEIKAELEKLGHFYPITTLSGVVLFLIKKRNLRRIKSDKVWGYVKTQ